MKWYAAPHCSGHRLPYSGLVVVLQQDVVPSYMARNLSLYDQNCFTYWRHAMNTIIYIVGLVVVVGLVLSFFGLR